LVTKNNQTENQEQEHEYVTYDNELEKFTFFWSNKSPFSQHYLANFTVNDTAYISAEQYMMEQKALLFGDVKTAELIMMTKCPKKQKRLGRTAVGFNQLIWDDNSLTIVL